jgi:GntR family transcriptional regulator of arabinose operon
MRIDADKPVPKYLQLKDIIKQYLKNEEYKPDQKIPSEHEFAAQFHISRNTVRQALQELVSEGFIYKKQGMGSFFSGKTQNDQPDRSHLIGVITPLIASYIYPQIIQGVDDIARQKRYNMVLGSSNASPEKELACLQQMLEKHIDGLLFESTGGFDNFRDSSIFRILQQLTIPVVFMDWAPDDLDISYVSLDDVEGGFKATSFLAQAGHTRIACVYPRDHLAGRQRYEGYRKALDAYQIEYKSQLDKPTTALEWNRADPGYYLTKELLALGPNRPSAIFFFNDDAALRSYSAIRDADLKIPDDISIMGFDDFEFAAIAEVPLTTVVHPKYGIGKWAAEILLTQIENPLRNLPTQLRIHPSIVVRDSVKSLVP